MTHVSSARLGLGRFGIGCDDAYGFWFLFCFCGYCNIWAFWCFYVDNVIYFSLAVFVSNRSLAGVFVFSARVSDYVLAVKLGAVSRCLKSIALAGKLVTCVH